jgi:F-type H+-transporting ATPase subunit gamma
MVVEEFLLGAVSEVFLAYTDFINIARQEARIKQLLPLELEVERVGVDEFAARQADAPPAYEYEPDQKQILDEIIPRFTALQVYQAILESLASEHAAHGRHAKCHGQCQGVGRSAGAFIQQGAPAGHHERHS